MPQQADWLVRARYEGGTIQVINMWDADPESARREWKYRADHYLDNPHCTVVELVHMGEVVSQKAQDYSEGYTR